MIANSIRTIQVYWPAFLIRSLVVCCPVPIEAEDDPWHSCKPVFVFLVHHLNCCVSDVKL